MCVCVCVSRGEHFVAGSVGSWVEGGSGGDTTVAGRPVPRVSLQRRTIRSLHSGMFSMYTETCSTRSPNLKSRSPLVHTLYAHAPIKWRGRAHLKVQKLILQPGGAQQYNNTGG